jgi:hypothetical protein
MTVITCNHAYQFFFQTSLLTPAHSSYPFLYTICKRPISSYPTSTLLNCTTLDYCPVTSTLLNCQHSWPSSGMMLNCRTAQTMDDMPSSHHRHLRHLGLLSILGYWMDDMPSSHSGHLRHLSHLSHLGYLGTVGNLDTLDPYPLDSAPTDSPLKAFITKLDPEDPGLLEGYHEDDLLDPLSISTPLLPATPPFEGGSYIRQIDT